MESLGHFLQSISTKHDRLKKHIHTAYRVPLSPKGILFMKCVYLTVPVVAGMYVMSLAIDQSKEKWASKEFELRQIQQVSKRRPREERSE